MYILIHKWERFIDCYGPFNTIEAASELKEELNSRRNKILNMPKSDLDYNTLSRICNLHSEVSDISKSESWLIYQIELKA